MLTTMVLGGMLKSYKGMGYELSPLSCVSIVTGS